MTWQGMVVASVLGLAFVYLWVFSQAFWQEWKRRR